MSAILDVKNIKKSFRQPDKSRLTVLENLSLSVKPGSIISVAGVSGSGKSTLLHLLGSLDVPDSGEIWFKDKNIVQLKGLQRARYRNRSVGFVFQFHYLMPELNVLENVAFPALMKEFNRDEAMTQGRQLLDDIGLSTKVDYMPYQLSGGERQRVAIARSLINRPEILLADEPTGNLDWKTGQKVFEIFHRLIREMNRTAIVVTHNEKLARLVDRQYHLQDGKLVS